MRLRKRNTSGELKTWAIIKGVEREVQVCWENSPSQWDNNWAGGLVIDCVVSDGDFVTEELSKAETAVLLERVERLLGEGEYGDSDDYGDYLYEQCKDDRGNEP